MTTHRSLGAAVLVWLAALPTLRTATITFEEGIPEPGSVDVQYCSLAAFNRGVQFLEGGGQLVELGAGTASPTHALIVRRIGEEFDQTRRLVIAFTAPQNEVSFRVGLDRAYPFSVVALVSAYTTPEPVEGAGHVVANYVLDRGPTPIDQFLSVNASSINGPIRCVVIECVGDWGTTHAAYEVIDDLTFDNPGPQCTSDTIGPQVEITRPGADDWPVYSPNLRLGFRAYDEGTSTAAGVARVRISLLDQHGTVLGDPAIVCGSDPSACPTCPSCPAQQRRGEFLTWAEFWTTLHPATQSIRVEAWDLVGNHGQDVRRINFLPAGTQANLWVGAVEVTQGIQTVVLEQPQSRLPEVPSVSQPTPPFGGTPPLVANRATILRVYPRMEGPAGAPDLWATARLFAFVEKEFGRLEPHLTVPVWEPRESAVRVLPGYDLDALRRGTRPGWVFVLPRAWTQPGLITLRVDTAADLETPECPACGDGANSLEIYRLRFEAVPRFTDLVTLQPIRRFTPQNPQGIDPEPGLLRDTLDFIRQTYPVDETTVSPHAAWLRFDDDPTKSGVSRSDALTTRLQLWFPKGFWVWSSDRPYYRRQVCGLVDFGFAVGLGGWTSGTTRHAWARVGGSPAAHEIGHSFGLHHAGPEPGHSGGGRDECGWGLGSCDADWPYPHGTIGNHFGFDILMREPRLTGWVIPPFNPILCSGLEGCESARHDFMSYGAPRWVSPRNWIRLYNALTGQDLSYPQAAAFALAGLPSPGGSGGQLQSGAEPPPAQFPRSVLLSGRQEEPGRWALYPAFELDVPLGLEGPGTGTHRIAMADAQGRLLLHRFFTPLAEHADPDPGEPSVEAPPVFAGLLPLPDGVAAIALFEGATELAAIAREPVGPQVRLRSPTALGFEGQPDQPFIRWIGRPGRAGQESSYLVQYAARTNAQGQPDWRTLAAHVSGEELPVALDGLEGSDTARVRVLASDGLNTGVAVSEPFVVPNHAPQAEIISRGGSDRMVLGERVVMRGTAMDLEDGLVEESALTWRSHLDGPLATGNTLAVGRLRPGVHEITLEARDAQGAVGTATVTLEVLRAPNHQPVATATRPTSVRPGQSVLLDGAASHDADGDALTYHWSLVLAPPGSAAQLIDRRAVAPGFNADLPGEYAALLTVHDGQVGSYPSQVNVYVPAHPPNDAFADAEPIAGMTGAVSGYNVDATTEAQEPADLLAGRTVWWRWQSPETTNAFFEVRDADFNVLLSVYRGSGLGELLWVATDTGRSRAEFRAEAGIAYWVRVGGERGAAGAFTLRWGALTALPGTVAWYPFDGNAQDASGNAHHGTAFGSTLAPDRFCRPDAAYRFTGARDQRIELAPPDAFNPRDAFTIALWAYPTDINGWRMLFTKWDDLARRFFIHFATSGGRLQFSVSSTGTDYGEGLTDATLLPLNTWTHCVAVADRHTGELKLYRNSQLAASRALPPFAFPDLPQTGVRLGGKVDGNYSFHGTLDDVLFLDRALTDAEVTELFESQLELPGAASLPTVVQDDFSGGLATVGWTVIRNTPTYQVQVRPGDVRFSRAAGGAGGYQFVGLQPPSDLEGDFDVQVDFREAQLKRANGSPGNQINLIAQFGSQVFAVTRSDETANPADNVHVWADPPAQWFGTQPSSALTGTLRIARSGPWVAGFWNGTLLHSACHNTNRAALSFSLANNGTSDATAVTFDNFRLTADRLIPWAVTAPVLTVEALDRAQVRLSWPVAAVGFALQSAESLSDPRWTPVAVVPSVRDGTNYVIQPIPTTAQFYRLRGQ